MKQKASILILITLLLSTVVILGECRRGSIPESPGILITHTATEGTGRQTPVETASQPTTQTTNTVSAPTTEIPYPLPTYPTDQETEIPYPEPPTEEYYPTLMATPGSGYPSPLETSTQPVYPPPQASQSPKLTHLHRLQLLCRRIQERARTLLRRNICHTRVPTTHLLLLLTRNLVTHPHRRLIQDLNIHPRCQPILDRALQLLVLPLLLLFLLPRV